MHMCVDLQPPFCSALHRYITVVHSEILYYSQMLWPEEKH